MGKWPFAELFESFQDYYVQFATISSSLQNRPFRVLCWYTFRFGLLIRSQIDKMTVFAIVDGVRNCRKAAEMSKFIIRCQTKDDPLPRYATKTGLKPLNPFGERPFSEQLLSFSSREEAYDFIIKNFPNEEFIDPEPAPAALQDYWAKMKSENSEITR